MLFNDKFNCKFFLSSYNFLHNDLEIIFFSNIHDIRHSFLAYAFPMFNK